MALVCLSVVLSGGSAVGATSSTLVTATVLSATYLSIDPADLAPAGNCKTGAANRVDFGSLLPGTSTVTTQDCAVVFGSSNDTAMLKMYQQDSRGTGMWRPTDGSFDTSFDGDGKATTPVGASSEYASATAVQTDGKVLAAGYVNDGGFWNFGVVRYNTNGSLDTTFDTDGKVLTHIGAADDFARAMVLQTDGKIVVAGSSYNGSNQDVALVRYNTDGSLDTSFDTDGKVTTDIGAGDDFAYGVTVQADGKIVIDGWSYNGTDTDVAVARYNTNGSLDTTFDTDGKVTTPIAGNDYGYGVAIQADGKIVVTGTNLNAGTELFAQLRYNTNGSLDTSFDTDGIVTTAMGAGDAVSYGVVIQPDGKIVVAGQAYSGVDDDFALARYNTNGSLDTTFDTDGKLLTSVGKVGTGTAGAGNGGNWAYSMVLQADGKIIVAGKAYSSTNIGKIDFALARYTTTGSLDTSFNSTGALTTTIGAGYEAFSSIALQSDGRIVAVGRSNNGTDDDFAVMQFDAVQLSDFASGSADWATANTNLFGACLMFIPHYAGSG